MQPDQLLIACPKCHAWPMSAHARKMQWASAAPLVAEKGLTLVGFAVSGIDRSGVQQLMLPFNGESLAVDAAVDEIHRRYGKAALTRAVLVGRDPGLEMPHLPD